MHVFEGKRVREGSSGLKSMCRGGPSLHPLVRLQIATTQASRSATQRLCSPLQQACEATAKVCRLFPSQQLLPFTFGTNPPDDTVVTIANPPNSSKLAFP